MGVLALLAQAADEVASGAAEAVSAQDLQLLGVMALLGLPVWIYAINALVQRRSPLPFELHPPVPWRGPDVVTVLVAAVVIQFLGPALLLSFKGVRVTDETGQLLPDAIAPLLAADSVAQLTALIVAICLLMARSGADWNALGFDSSRLPRDVLIGVLTFVAIVPLIILLQIGLTQIWPSEHPLVTLVRGSNDRGEVLRLAAWRAAVVAPLVEEFLFRVVLQGWLQKVERAQPRGHRWAPRLPLGTVPVLTSSLVFAALHAGHGPDPIPLFLLALALGYLYHQTNRLWPSWTVHTLLNGMSVAALWLEAK